MKKFFLYLTTATFLHAQGPLTPPGAPAPTMKTLDQVEARKPIPASPVTPISGPHFTITEPGSYYFTGNVTVTDGPGIVINADNVTLDLNGYTLACSASSELSSAGIVSIVNRSGLSITNGIISSSSVVTSGNFSKAGWNYGILAASFSSASIRNVIVKGVHEIGIVSEAGSVTGCIVTNCDRGIYAKIVDSCAADQCWLTAIYGSSVVSKSSGSSLNDIGIHGETVTGCVGKGVTQGIVATNVSDSTGYSFFPSGNSYGILCKNAHNSIGTGQTIGIFAEQNVTGCKGESTRGIYIPVYKHYGIFCQNATSSTGKSAGNGYSTGIYASGNVSDCTGSADLTTSGYSIGLIGIQCSNASNSHGTAQNYGIRALANATNCYGKASDGLQSAGIEVDGTASFCRGDHNSNFGVALEADIAIGCTKANGSINSSSKHLGTP